MTTGQYPRQTSGTFTVNCQASQVIVVWPCLPSWYSAKNHTTWNSRWQSSQRKTVHYGGTTTRNGQASHSRRCCASQTTEVDGRPLQWRHPLEYPNDASASRMLDSYNYPSSLCTYILFSVRTHKIKMPTNYHWHSLILTTDWNAMHRI